MYVDRGCRGVEGGGRVNRWGGKGKGKWGM